MRPLIGLAAAAAALVLTSSALRADGLDAPNAASIVSMPAVSGPSVAPNLYPAYYAAEMLPASPSHPWVIMPRFGTLWVGNPNLRYGFRTSPYGEYSRYAYYATGPYVGLPRPYIRAEDRICRKWLDACP